MPSSPLVRDRLLAGGLVVILLFAYAQSPAGALCGAALVWRRRYPVVVFAVLATAFAVSLVGHLDSAGPLLWLTWIALYGVPAYGRRRPALVAGVVTALATAGVVVFMLATGGPSSGGGATPAVLLAGAYVATAWLLGGYHRTRHAYLQGRADRIAREQAALVQQAAAEERAWLARELHDMLAHTMSGIVVLAGGARRIAATQPDRAVATIGEIERVGRRGMDETRRILDAVRDTGGGYVAASSGLADLPALLDRTRALGLEVRMVANEPPPILPPLVDGCAYRIVQEALANGARHGGATTAEVGVTAAEGVLDVAITDDGRVTGEATPGHGLAGMRERVQLLGGRLRAGPRPGGGWEVRARLPVPQPIPDHEPAAYDS